MSATFKPSNLQTFKPSNLQTFKPHKALIALLAALVLCFCAACDSSGDEDSDAGSSAESLVTATELNGTYWEGSVTVASLGNITIPLTLDFESTTQATITVTMTTQQSQSEIPVTCDYTISGNSIEATGTGAWSNNDITMTVTEYGNDALKVTVASSSGTFEVITTGTEIDFTKSEKPADDDGETEDGDNSGDDSTEE